MTVQRSICISGTDRGIGLALVKDYLLEGYTVFAGGITTENEAFIQLSSQFPDHLHTSFLDVGSDASVQAFAAFIASKTDKLELLINNAAILGDMKQTVTDVIDFDEIQRVYNITALGAIRLTNYLIEPVMQGGQLIVNISSEAGSIRQSHRESWFGYSMAKAALNMGSTMIHTTIRKQGGRVLLIHPGWVKSAMNGSWSDAGTYTPEEAAANIRHIIKLNKDHIHEQPLYLAADTGEELPW
ncbi:SDR family NAD(P)-dependent oxidoreductase [Paenibacillus qinlingensis]|uniref:SDR family NAD(P)-dependent oxidoreductase n=1 Tax=Paenibacillus qinlingensis TaxID=1837343 RepID=UPI00156375DA|nr:SDR family NAD(P)-dependent oxidoreductase [Paenibacillus qinlingensis]NQX63418.1 SDR family NAD(P)-dependent oxidoreductase [Paenibacillus qinlingensis]